MQETGKLVLGIDLCDDITQVTVMRPHAAEPDAVCFDARTRKEFLPTLLCLGQDEVWSIGESVTPDATVLPPFFRAAVKGETVVFGDATYSAKELLGRYIALLMQKIMQRFEGQEIGFLAVTCEEAKDGEAAREMLREMFEEGEGYRGRCTVLSHLEAFLHFIIRQEEGLWKDGSAVFDYATDGLLFYYMECRLANGRRLFTSDYKDYSEVIGPDFVTHGDGGQGALTFERLAGEAMRQKPASLFVTGRGFEGDWVSDVLRFLSTGRRVFRGQNLYTQGACYAGAELFRGEQNVDFSILTPEQVTVDVFLLAENEEQEESVLLVKVGENYRSVAARAEVILDATDKLVFKILPAGETVPRAVRIAPNLPELRGDRTSRYEIRVFFAKRELMVIQMKETGFGAFYPQTYRIYEELLDFSRWEQ